MAAKREWLITGGVDAGASTAKAAILRTRSGDGGEVLGSATQKIRRRNLVEVVRSTFDEACREASVAPDTLDYVASTGDGDAVDFRTGHFYSMTSHARGGIFLVPEARAVLDIGALHARAIRADGRGQVLAHRMTSQCASGSGQFLENIARYLGVPLQDVGALSREATAPEEPSSICAVLSETDVINMVSRGVKTADILKGIHLSIAGRLARLVGAIRAEGTVAMTGGLAHDEGLVAALNELLESHENVRVKHHRDSILAGAMGAALLGAFRYRQLEKRGHGAPLAPVTPGSSE